LVSLCFLGVVWTNVALAQDDEEEEEGEEEVVEVEDEWVAERKKIEDLIEARIEQELDKLVNKRDIAVKLRLGWPVREPKQTKDELEKAVDERIAAEVDKKFPMTAIEDFRQEGKQEYRLYTKGDVVSFVIRGGRGPNSRVGGKLFKVTNTQIHVMNPRRTIARSDVNEADLAHFYKDIHEKYVDRHVRVQTIRYNSKREGHQAELKRALMPKALRAGEYVPKGKRHARSYKTENWISKSDVLEHFYKLKRKSEEKKIRDLIVEEIFTANNYTYVEEQGQWVPPKVAKSWADKLKGLVKGKKGDDEEDDEDFEDFGDEDEDEDEDEEDEDEAAQKAKRKGKPHAPGPGFDEPTAKKRDKVKKSEKSDAFEEEPTKKSSSKKKKKKSDDLFDEEQ